MQHHIPVKAAAKESEGGIEREYRTCECAFQQGSRALINIHHMVECRVMF